MPFAGCWTSDLGLRSAPPPSASGTAGIPSLRHLARTRQPLMALGNTGMPTPGNPRPWFRRQVARFLGEGLLGCLPCIGPSPGLPRPAARPATPSRTEGNEAYQVTKDKQAGWPCWRRHGPQRERWCPGVQAPNPPVSGCVRLSPKSAVHPPSKYSTAGVVLQPTPAILYPLNEHGNPAFECRGRIATAGLRGAPPSSPPP